ncbi:MAG TPA: aminotransferase class V-fold PLP-dependent enzyme [Candidatus Elarobacter sp.]|nr:aminotransferase class V-fold PLP-dependent enzyme [Candidatus Elarobacter sp.]
MRLDRQAEFPWTTRGDVVYCNAASTGPLPSRTAAVLDEWTRLRSEPWRITLEQQFGALATARRLCAGLIGADADEIALAPNTSTGINIAAQILPVAKDRVILGHDGEFPANVYPWMAIGRRGGARFEQLALDETGLPDWDALQVRLDRGDVGLVAISWVSFVSGDRADLASIGALCRERGAWFVVDAIQGVGTTRLDVHACNVDILACGAQKWLLSPWGSGFCYVRRELVERLEPRAVGWLAMRHAEDFSRMLEYDHTYFDDARRFEVATIPYQDMAGMNASLSLIDEVGLDCIEAHVHGLVSRLIDGIASVRGATLLTPRDPARRAGIVSLTVPDGPAVSRRLDDAGIVHSIRGGGVLRLAPHLYNTDAEMDRVLERLDG